MIDKFELDCYIVFCHYNPHIGAGGTALSPEERKGIREAAESILSSSATETAAKKKLEKAKKREPFRGVPINSHSVQFSGSTRYAKIHISGELPIEVQV
ncbi:TPA: hypothetical protein DF272_02190 [Candidatus Falkowbacteria bacterium]|nr:hypothetical protein [Candidatus Falkowbacteria bacterium]